MNSLQPLQTLFDAGDGIAISLPPRLKELYGTLSFPLPGARPHIISNFVSTLDGVVTLGLRGMIGGDAISGKSLQDAAVMGLLRAVSDVVVIGAGNLRASPKHIWTAERVFRDLADEYKSVRSALGKSSVPLNVIITERGEIDFSLPIFQTDTVDVLIVTKDAGANRLHSIAGGIVDGIPARTTIAVVQFNEANDTITAREIVAEIMKMRPTTGMILHEGGPLMMAPFYRERMVDELFLTFSPQVAGRDGKLHRPGFLDGIALAPDIPTWGKLISVRQGGSHLFLRYRFNGI